MKKNIKKVDSYSYNEYLELDDKKMEEVMKSYIDKNTGLFFTVHNSTKESPSNKMNQMVSCNTTTEDNYFCRKMAKVKGSICQECYARKIEAMYRDAYNRYCINTHILNDSIIPVESMPIVKSNNGTCRLDAMGELATDNQYINFQNLALANNNTLFTLWTKRVDIVHRNFNKSIKILLHIYSSPFINKKVELPEHFNKTFTVYSANYIETHKVKINCQKSCAECMLCYSKNQVHDIREQLKTR